MKTQHSQPRPKCSLQKTVAAIWMCLSLTFLVLGHLEACYAQPRMITISVVIVKGYDREKGRITKLIRWPVEAVINFDGKDYPVVQTANADPSIRVPASYTPKILKVTIKGKPDAKLQKVVTTSDSATWEADATGSALVKLRTTGTIHLVYDMLDDPGTEPGGRMQAAIWWQARGKSVSHGGPMLFEDQDKKIVVVVRQLGGPSGLMTKPINPVSVKLFYDGLLIGEGVTNKENEAIFPFTPPDSTPQGLSTHSLRAVATKAGWPTEESLRDLEIRRGTSFPTQISVNASAGRYLIGDAVTLTGRVYAPRYMVWSQPVKAKIEVSNRAQSVISKVTTDADGNFKILLPVQTTLLDLDKKITLTVEATPLEKTYEASHTDLMLQVESRGQLQATVLLSKAVCAPEEMIAATGIVVADGKPVACKVDIFLDNKPLISVPTDAGGRYEYSFAVAAAASQQRIFVIEGYHLLTVVPNANGYERGSGSSVSFAVQDSGAGRALQEIEVTQVSGKPDLTAPVTPDTPFQSPPALRSGGKLTQGYTVTTKPGDQVTLKMPFGSDANVQITLSGSTSLRIAEYRQDASGKIKLRVHLSNPGRLDVSVTNPGPAPLDYAIITPTASVHSVKTSYQVKVDASGTTTIAATEGEVLLTPGNAALAPATLRAGQQAQVSSEKISQNNSGQSMQNDQEKIPGDILPSLDFALEIGSKNGNIVIASMGNNPLAAILELRAGDRVLSIDGKSTDGLSVEQARALMRGGAATKPELTLKILRSSDGEQITILLQRKGSTPFGDVAAERSAVSEANRKQADEFMDKGIAFSTEGQWSEAEAEYRKALRLDPTRDRGWIMLGQACEEQGKWAEAVVAYRELVKLAPHSGANHADLAGALLKQGKRADAMREAKEAIRLGEKEHPVFEELGLNTE